MAFYTQRGVNYFSLSMNPDGDANPYVFRVRASQMAFISKCLPVLLLLTSSAFLLIAVLGLVRLLRAGGWITDEQFTTTIVAAACASGLAVMVETQLFLWIRLSPSSLLSAAEVRDLHDLQLVRGRSLMLYATFVLAMFAPFLGLLLVPGGSTAQDSGADVTNLPNILLMSVLGIAAFLLLLACVRRILHIIAH